MAQYLSERKDVATVDESWIVPQRIINFEHKRFFDELSKVVSFNTGMTGFLSGQYLDASRTPVDGGVTVQLTATSNLSTNLRNERAQADTTAWMFKSPDEAILRERSKGRQ